MNSQLLFHTAYFNENFLLHNLDKLVKKGVEKDIHESVMYAPHYTI